MPEADLELVRRTFAAWGPDMFEAGVLTEDHEFRPTVTGSDLVQQPRFYGREGLADYWCEADRAWTSLELELDDLNELWDGAVLSRFRLNAVGRKSGVPVSAPTAGLHVIRDGQIALTHAYATVGEARAAADELRLEVTRVMFDAFNRGDVEEYIAWCDPEAEWYPLLADIEGPRLGHDGMRAWLRETAQIFDEFAITADEVRFTGRVGVVFGHLTGRGRGSRVPFEQEVAITVEFRGLRMYRARAYPTIDAALEAAGA